MIFDHEGHEGTRRKNEVVFFLRGPDKQGRSMSFVVQRDKDGATFSAHPLDLGQCFRLAAAGTARWRYAIAIFGGVPRSFAPAASPRIPSSRLTAKESRVSKKVTNSTRTGIQNHRGWRAGVLVRDMTSDCSAAISTALGLRGARAHMASGGSSPCPPKRVR